MFCKIHTYDTSPSEATAQGGGEICMKGSIHLRTDTRHPWWFVKWYHDGEFKRISWYKRKRMYQTHPDKDRDYGYELARKLRSEMQADVERGVFRIEKYKGIQYTDVIPFFRNWLRTKKKKKPATYKGYKSYLDNWIEPFFEENPVMLHEIQLDTLDQFLDFINLTGKGKLNVMMCFHTFLDYCWRSKRIPEMPPFPKLEDYGIVKPILDYLTPKEQQAVYDHIPEPQIYPFLWLSYHYRRPGEVCALYKTDYNPINNSFTVRRAISARELVESTKTSQVHYIPCKAEFTSIARKLINQNLDSPFMFVNPRARKDGRRYTLESLRNVWYKACDDADIRRIWPYRGTKHTTCMSFLEGGGTIEELQMLTDHKDKRSLDHYAEVTLQHKRALMERDRNVIEFRKRKVG